MMKQNFSVLMTQRQRSGSMRRALNSGTAKANSSVGRRTDLNFNAIKIQKLKDAKSQNDRLSFKLHLESGRNNISRSKETQDVYKDLKIVSRLEKDAESSQMMSAHKNKKREGFRTTLSTPQMISTKELVRFWPIDPKEKQSAKMD